MKLSDIKGENALGVVADAMELADLVADDDRFPELSAELKDCDEDAMWRVFCKHVPPILRDSRYQERLISILAAAAGVPYEEYAAEGPVLADLFELLTTDAESLGFFLGSAAIQK